MVSMVASSVEVVLVAVFVFVVIMIDKDIKIRKRAVAILLKTSEGKALFLGFSHIKVEIPKIVC